MSETETNDDVANGQPVEVSELVSGAEYNNPDEKNSSQTADAIPITAEFSPVDISAALGELRQSIDCLIDTTQGLRARDQVRQQAFEQLYKELEGYKRDFILDRLRPMFPMLLSLYDGIQDYADYLATVDTVTSESVQQNIQSLCDELTQALDVCGVIPIVPGGDELDRRVQRIVDTVPVASEALANKVFKRHRTGFLLGGKVLRPEHVTVTRLKKDDIEHV